MTTPTTMLTALTTPTSRTAAPEHRGSLARVLASTTLHTALAGPIRHAAQDATHMIEVAERALTMTLQDLRAAKVAP